MKYINGINKIIELKDDKICLCSENGSVAILDNYCTITTLITHNKSVISIIEMNNFIISASYDNTLRIWDETTYECIQTIEDVCCSSSNTLSKLDDDTLIIGGDDIIYLVDIKNYEVNLFRNESFGEITCLYVNGNELVLIGNKIGEIVCYCLSSNRVISIEKFHYDRISCIIKGEDNQLISSSYDNTINIYK